MRNYIDYSDRNSETYRRIKQRRQKLRRRQRMIKSAALCILTVIIAIVVVSTISHISKGANSGSESDDAGILADNANVQGETATTAQPKISIVYPTISSSYVDIKSTDVKSQYVALLDIENHSIVAGRDCQSKMYPASMTKVMTLIVAVENLKSLNDTYSMTNEMLDPLVKQNASRAGFDPSENVSAKDLLYGLILPSGADAAEGLARMISGSDEAFAKLMNKKCEEMGLKNTHFMNPSGLHDSNQYTTPIEMAIIMEYAMADETCAKVLSTYQYTTAVTKQHPEGISLTSTMFGRMYGDEVEGVTIIAGKVGYTEEAGNCLVSYAKKGDIHYVAVTASATNKWHSIYDAFELYDTYTLDND